MSGLDASPKARPADGRHEPGEHPALAVPDGPAPRGHVLLQYRHAPRPPEGLRAAAVLAVPAPHQHAPVPVVAVDHGRDCPGHLRKVEGQHGPAVPSSCAPHLVFLTLTGLLLSAALRLEVARRWQAAGSTVALNWPYTQGLPLGLAALPA